MSGSSWLATLRRPQQRTHDDEVSGAHDKDRPYTLRLNILYAFHWAKRMITPSLYAQVPLCDFESEIRLLEILPGTTNPIRCRLRSVPLTDSSDYEGLSYHWSGDLVERHVYVNGVHVSVRGNLYNALRYLRYADKPRVLWIDAICIDQERNEEDGEKNHQLRLMRRIYGQAQRTIAYIGREVLDENGTQMLDGFVKRLLDSIEQLRRTEEWADSLGRSAHHLNDYARMQYNIPNNDDIGWQNLGHVVSRTWSDRLWVVQEATVARDVVIQCGPYSFHFEDIAAAFALMWTLNVPVINGMQTTFKAIIAERAKESNGQQRTLLSLVIRHWLSACQYPHDKIYALRGLACDVEPGKHNNDINYGRNVDEVYTDFAREAIQINRNLDIISALAPFHPRRSHGLPSWVPDWRVFGSSTLVYRRPEPLPEPGPCNILFGASGKSSTEPVFSRDGRRVQLQGHILDTIVDVGDIRPAQRTPRIAVAHFLGWRKDIAGCLPGAYYEPTHERMVDVFYHTITMANLSNFLDDKTALAEYNVFDDLLTMLGNRIAGHGFDYEDPDIYGVIPGATPAWLRIEQSIVTSASRPSVNRRMVRTEKGYLGLVHGQTRIGDKIALFRGGVLPLVIRKQEDEWHMVGDGYVHGVMKGEMFNDNKCQSFWFS
jgi:hypothetical protein